MECCSKGGKAFEIFFFVNSKSGGNKGAEFVTLKVNTLFYQFKNKPLEKDENSNQVLNWFIQH